MIKSSRLSILLANVNRRNDIQTFITEYKRICQVFVDVLWTESAVPRLINKNTTDKVQTWLSSRAVQACAKQASGIVRGTKMKQSKRKHKYDEFIKKGMFKKARKLKCFMDAVKISKPMLKTLQPELDSRFVKFCFNNETTFDCWIELQSLGNKMKILLPAKKTKHFNWLDSVGKMKTGLRLSPESITIMFDMPEVLPKKEGTTVGIDVGIKTVCSCSNGQCTKQDRDGWNLDGIQQKLSRRKKGSNGFKRAQQHRDNHIGWCVNQLNLTGVKKVKIENIFKIRKNKKSSRYMSHWTYTTLFEKLLDYCYQQGVLVDKINPTYTSQRCSCCGWTRKSNRKGKAFKCGSCGYTVDSDLNASVNISLDLPEVTKAERLLHKNRTGFYWLMACQARIVSDVQQVFP